MYLLLHTCPVSAVSFHVALETPLHQGSSQVGGSLAFRYFSSPESLKNLVHPLPGANALFWKANFTILAPPSTQGCFQLTPKGILMAQN